MIGKKILILNLCSKVDTLHHREFVKPIESIVKKITNNYEIKHFLEEYDVNRYSHIIISGVPLKDFEYEKHLDKFSWVSNFNGRIFGICAGAQIIGEIFNENIVDFLEIGLQKVDLVKEEKILVNCYFPLEIYGLHTKGFDEIKNFDILLRGDMPQLIKHKEKEIYACLFHPEVRNHNLIVNFIKDI